jgi:tetratricopeptide (TPR) repeat protein
MNTALKTLRFIVMLPFALPSFFRRVSKWIDESIADFAENLPDTLSDMSEGFGGNKQLSEHERLEKLLKSFLRRDLIMFGKNCQYTGRSMMSLADFYRSARRYGEADTYYLRALRAMESDPHLDPKDSKLIAARRTVASFMFAYCKYESAEYQLSLAITARGESASLELADDLNMLASICTKLGKPAQAIDCLLRELRIRERSTIGLDTTLDSLHIEIARLYEEIGDTTRAEALRRKALLLVEFSISERALGDEHYSLEKPLAALSAIYAAEGNIPKAEYLRNWESLVRLANKVKGLDYIALPRDLEDLANLYDKRNHHADRTIAHHARMRAKRIRDKRLNRH